MRWSGQACSGKYGLERLIGFYYILSKSLGNQTDFVEVQGQCLACYLQNGKSVGENDCIRVQLG